MINVSKPFLPPIAEYQAYLDGIWKRNWLTNNGPLLCELELKLKEYLGVNHLLFCANGTIVLQMALKSLRITKEVITTPFSYVATTNAILWESCKPVFVDIKPDTFCIDERKIERAVTENTQAILATHVYGIPCEVEKIEKIADKYKLKVIYDAAHAFGCKYKGKSLMCFGDVITCSFHATKIFHTVEGGAIICKDDELSKQLFLYRSFGHIGDDYYTIGINAKNSEMHAAMGLCILPRIEDIIVKRKEVFETYDRLLDLTRISKPVLPPEYIYNYAYYPVVFENEKILLQVREALLKNEVSTRRYFYPSLNQLPFLSTTQNCVISEGISNSVLSLPLYYDLAKEDIEHICKIINDNI